MVSAARCNAQYSFKTTRLKTFGSHLVWVVKMCTVFVLIMIRSRCGFCKLGKEALSSTTGTQNFEIFQNDTEKVVFLE
jgi:choline-glycine betaine transporter